METKKPVGGTRSQLGTQVNSRKASAPKYSFGSGTREGREHVFVSNEHAALEAGRGSPGPVYTHVPAIGPQVNGAMESAPRFGFGTSDREQAAKVYISAEHEKYSGGRFAPGPGKYDSESGVGTQHNSTKSTLPKYGFGTSTRANVAKVYVSEEHNKTTDYGRASPGPVYMQPAGIGKQVASGGPSPYASGGTLSMRNASQPSWVMGKAERFERTGAERAPGPGTYGVRPAVGAQVASTKPSLPRYGFGTSNREHAAKVYISPEHEKVSGGGKHVPGPGAYPIKSLTGKPVVSGKQVTGSSWGFGTSKRFTDAFKHQKGNPGPGHYVI